MSDSHYDITELRFVFRPDATHVYAYAQPLDDCPIGIQGWHHKAFPTSMSTIDILQAWAQGEETPILWPIEMPMAAVPEDNLRFNFGDEVRLTREAVALYGGKWPEFVPQGQGGGAVGIITQARFRGESKPGAEPRPYMVLWENGAVNSYREIDLEPAVMPTAAPEEPSPQAEVSGFKFKVVTGEED